MKRIVFCQKQKAKIKIYRDYLLFVVMIIMRKERKCRGRVFSPFDYDCTVKKCNNFRFSIEIRE